MKLSKWKRDKKENIEPGYFLYVSKHEAHKLLKSLAAQLCSNSINSEREEFFTDEGEYFTIGIVGEDTTNAHFKKLKENRHEN